MKSNWGPGSESDLSIRRHPSSEPVGQPAYRGRFAPSPTGALHLGSLYTALGSFLQARARGGAWFVRVEDLDPQRTIRDSAGRILKTLEEFGLLWDGTVLYQSRRTELYQAALEKLETKRLLYACICTRRFLARQSCPREPSYPGYCRDRGIDRDQPHALRIKAGHTPIRFHDRLHGSIEQALPDASGDFIVRRRDRAFAYQLAVVVDDDRQGITEVVRGCDLLDSTPRQIYLQQQLDIPTPEYLHLPVIIDAEGGKLSKRMRAAPVDGGSPSATLHHLLRLLNQTPPAHLCRATPAEVVAWAIEHWDVSKLRPVREIPLAQPGSPTESGWV